MFFSYHQVLSIGCFLCFCRNSWYYLYRFFLLHVLSNFKYMVSHSFMFYLFSLSLSLVFCLWRSQQTHLNDRASRGSSAHDWNFETASLPGLSPCDRSSWSWKQWQGPAERWLAHRQWHTRTPLFFPTHLLACRK